MKTRFSVHFSVRFYFLAIALFLLAPVSFATHSETFFNQKQEEYFANNLPVFAYFSQLYLQKDPEIVAKEYGLSEETSRKYLQALADIHIIRKFDSGKLPKSVDFLVKGVFRFSNEGPLDKKISSVILRQQLDRTFKDFDAKPSEKVVYVSTPGFWLSQKEYTDLQKDLGALEEKYIKLSLHNRKTKKPNAFRVSTMFDIIPKWEPEVFSDVKKNF